MPQEEKPRLSDQLAQDVIQAIEDVEKEEAGEARPPATLKEKPEFNISE